MELLEISEKNFEKYVLGFELGLTMCKLNCFIYSPSLIGHLFYLLSLFQSPLSSELLSFILYPIFNL